MIDTVVLDVGGVILSWRDDASRLDERLETELGLDEGEVGRRLWGSQQLRDAECGRLSAEEFWLFASKAVGASEDVLAQFNEDLWSKTQYLDERVVAWLGDLRRRRRVVAFTNAWSDARDELSRRYGFEALVDELVVSAEIGVAKPDPAAFSRLLTHLGVSADRVLFVDDQPSNVEGARRVGIAGAVCNGPEELIRTVEAALRR